jgi:hypothetical protein
VTLIFFTQNIFSYADPCVYHHAQPIDFDGRNLRLSYSCDKEWSHITKWSKDGREISVGDPEGKYSITEDQMSLVIARADHHDVGKYTCNITCGNHRNPTEIEFILGNFIFFYCS